MPRLRAAWLSFAAFLCCAGFQASAADRFFLYNLTTSTTFTGVYLAPAGSDRWGSNQALNDKDKSVEPSERLAIKDVARGRFDAKLVDPKGRTCMRRGIDLTRDTTFEIRDGDLTDCH
jgi:hypothetical protein